MAIIKLVQCGGGEKNELSFTLFGSEGWVDEWIRLRIVGTSP